MQSFTLQLPDGNSLAGHLCIPLQTSKITRYLPLLVCVHGGSYDAKYFDMDLEHSVVLLAHSIGAMVATVAAACHTGTEGYTLAGLITSGIGVEHVEESRQRMIQLLDDKTEFVLFDSIAKDAVMSQLPHKELVDPGVCIHTEHLNKPVPADELHDINIVWLKHWHKYSTVVKVPLMYGLGEFDGLWVSTTEAVQQYKSAFIASPRVECGIIPMAPHCIEMSFQSQGWLFRCFGFAQECAVSQGLLLKCDR